MFMRDSGQSSFTRSERIQRALMAWGALILFVMGIFLLIAPRRCPDAESMKVGDNGVQRFGDRDCYRQAVLLRLGGSGRSQPEGF
jgi:hypothetical protein